jgi:hypothetical protein
MASAPFSSGVRLRNGSSLSQCPFHPSGLYSAPSPPASLNPTYPVRLDRATIIITSTRMPATARLLSLRPCRPISPRQWSPLRSLFRRRRTEQRRSYPRKLGRESRMSVLRIIFWIRMMLRVLGLSWGRFRINIGGIDPLRLDLLG